MRTRDPEHGGQHLPLPLELETRQAIQAQAASVPGMTELGLSAGCSWLQPKDPRSQRGPVARGMSPAQQLTWI